MTSAERAPKELGESLRTCDFTFFTLPPLDFRGGRVKKCRLVWAGIYLLSLLLIKEHLEALLIQECLEAADTVLGDDQVILGDATAERERVLEVRTFVIGSAYEVEFADKALSVRISACRT